MPFVTCWLCSPNLLRVNKLMHRSWPCTVSCENANVFLELTRAYHLNWNNVLRKWIRILEYQNLTEKENIQVMSFTNCQNQSCLEKSILMIVLNDRIFFSFFLFYQRKMRKRIYFGNRNVLNKLSCWKYELVLIREANFSVCITI